MCAKSSSTSQQKNRWSIMHKFIFALFSALTLTATAYAVTVDGLCYLEGQQNHAGTKVKFIKVSPSAVTDSTYTDAAGYFVKSVVPGIYDVEYSRDAYLASTLQDQLIVSSYTIWDIYLESSNGISGTLSGEIGPGYYRVTGHLYIDPMDTVRILPGTTFRFDGPYVFQVMGNLDASGIEGDSILFIRDYTYGSAEWQGFYLIGGGEAEFEFCKFAGSYSNQGGAIYSQACSLRVLNCRFSENRAPQGGAIYVTGIEASITHSTFQSNNATTAGGAIYLNASNGKIDDCQFVGCYVNAGAPRGGAVYLDNSSPVFRRCRFYGNRTQGYDSRGGAVYGNFSSSTFDSCVFDSNFVNPGNYAQGSGGAVYLQFGSQNFSNCEFTQNWILPQGNSSGYGGAAFFAACSPSIDRCVFADNRAGQGVSNSAGYGGAIDLEQCGGYISNSSFIKNGASTQGGNLYLYSSSTWITSSIISYTTSGEGIRFNSSASAQLQYCDVYGNAITGFGNHWEAPPAIGLKLVTNANGDSADIYLNIFEDPLFADTSIGDYSLLPGSPCIDAGDPDLPRDPDSTIADIGAFFYAQDLIVWPRALAFGSVAVGASDSLMTTIYNRSNSPLTIYSISSTDAHFVSSYNPADSVLAAGDTLEIWVVFAPTDSEFFSGELTVISNSITNDTITVALSGEGGLIPAPVDDVVLQLLGSDAQICWSTVDSTLYGSPLMVDAYIIYFAENASGPFWFHGLTSDTCYTHSHAAQFANAMFYEVSAFIGEINGINQVVAEHAGRISREELSAEMAAGLWKYPREIREAVRAARGR
jgi:predicted outer membrane repeat protein